MPGWSPCTPSGVWERRRIWPGSRCSWRRMNHSSPRAVISMSMAASRYGEDRMAEPFRVAMTRDVIRPDGSLGFGGIGVGLMQNAPGIEMVFLDKHPSAFTPEDLAGFDALAML